MFKIKKQKSAKKNADHKTRQSTTKRSSDHQALQRLVDAKAATKSGNFHPMKPRGFETNGVITLKRRLQFSAATAYVVSAQDIFNVMGGCNVSAVLNVPDYWEFRLKKVELWSWLTTFGTPVAAALQDLGIDSGENDFNGRATLVEDVCNSPDFPAHVKMLPVPTTPMGSWHNGAAATAVQLFKVFAAANSVMDLTCELVQPYFFGENQYTRVVVGASVGTHTCLGINTGTGNIVLGVTNG